MRSARLISYAISLVAAFVIILPSIALAATPTVIDPASGSSAFSYRDLSDVSDKREGGYAAFDSSEEATWYANPHGGYDTTTNKCKVCHAVHRAQGAYYLLRADSQDDACDYCHIGGSAHSSAVVYDGGTYTENGHTIGAQSQIPDSTISQWTESVTLSTTDASGNPLTETISVRAYSDTKNSMYRFTRHHGHGDWGTGRAGYGKVGPLALRCMNCHQTHNAQAQVWRPYDVSPWGVTGGTRSTGYKLLKLFPSGTTVGAANTYGYYEPGQVVKVPETTLTAGSNYSQNSSADFTYDEFGDGDLYAAPIWVAQRIGPAAGDEYGSDRDATAVNTAALSVWCGDCHNLNVGGSIELSNVELGFKAHTERTHPAPFTGAFNGPGQCYSCHRSNLPRINNGDPCSQCHYGTGNYRENRVDTSGLEYADSDFPHSGEVDGYKLLGSYSVDVAGLQPTSIVETVTVGPNNLDAVCVRCHWVQEEYHPDAVPPNNPHEIPSGYSACTDCHPLFSSGGASGASVSGMSVSLAAVTIPEPTGASMDVTDIHADVGCRVCHQADVLTTDCGTCHPDQIAPHGYSAAQHTATPGSGPIVIFEDNWHDDAGWSGPKPYFDVTVACTLCHGTELGPLHGDQCSTCHPTPYDTITTWNGTCQQGGCHVTYHEDSTIAHIPWEDAYDPGNDCNVCHKAGFNVTSAACVECHATYNPGDTTPPVTTSNAQTSYIGAARIQFTLTDGGKVGVGTTYFRVDNGALQAGSEAVVSAAGAHTIEFWSVDQAGNVESPHKFASFTVILDTTAPVTTSNAQATYTGTANITLTATDDAPSGVKATYYQLDGGSVKTGTFVSVPRVGMTEQPHTLTFWSEDYSGNVETAKTVSFKIVAQATIRLVWWDADVNPSHAPTGDEWASWTIRRGVGGPIVSTGYRAAPWSGVDDIVVPVSATPYWVSVSYQYWSPSAGFYDEDQTIFSSVLVDDPGEVVRLSY